jgi:hypothetical protein
MNQAFPILRPSSRNPDTLSVGDIRPGVQIASTSGIRDSSLASCIRTNTSSPVAGLTAGPAQSFTLTRRQGHALYALHPASVNTTHLQGNLLHGSMLGSPVPGFGPYFWPEMFQWNNLLLDRSYHYIIGSCDAFPHQLMYTPTSSNIPHTGMSYDSLDLAASLQHSVTVAFYNPPDFGLSTLRAASDPTRIFCHLRPSLPSAAGQRSAPQQTGSSFVVPRTD